ncbi:hypothetical protein CLIM01_14895, partial [Colletotrichum limetticola]
CKLYEIQSASEVYINHIVIWFEQIAIVVVRIVQICSVFIYSRICNGDMDSSYLRERIGKLKPASDVAFAKLYR